MELWSGVRERTCRCGHGQGCGRVGVAMVGVREGGCGYGHG